MGTTATARWTRAALCLCFLFASGACASAPTLQFRPVPDACTISGADVTLPARLQAGVFVVEATIDGRGPYHLVLDTGASALVLSPRVADELDLPRGGVASVEGTFAVGGAQGTEIRVPQAARVREVRIGGAVLRGIDAMLIDMAPFGRATGVAIDGLLPAGAFPGFLVTMDFAAGEVVVAQGVLPPPDGGDVLPLDDGTLPHVTVEVGGRAMSLLIDSGSTDFLSVPGAAAAGLRFRAEPRVTGRFMTIAGPVASTQARLQGDVAWGRHRLVQPVVTLNAGDEGTCGTALLDAFRTTFDTANRRVRFERTSAAPIHCKPVRSPGFGVLRGGDTWTVAYVLGGTPAATAGLRVGDRIATVDGLPAAQIGSTLFAVIVAASPSIRLGVVRPDGVRELVVPVATLVE